MKSDVGRLHTTVQAPTARARSRTQELPIMGRPLQLVVLLGGATGARFALEGDEIVIGRDPKSAIWLPDGAVSRRHACLRRTPAGAYAIHDLGSRNGVRVNGCPVGEQVLCTGDMVGIGPSTVMTLTPQDPQQQKLDQLQRLEALGQLVGGVVHDFNNVFSAVGSNARYLEQQVTDEVLRACVADTREAAERGTELTRRLFDFARAGADEAHPLDIAGVIGDVVAVARHSLPAEIRLETAIGLGISVMGDRLQLFQAVLNLMIHARDAMPEGGCLRLATGTRTLSEQQAGTLGLPLGSYATIIVEDSGPGMDPEARRRIFEPFSSGAEGGETGLRLPMAYAAIKRHGGELGVHSEAGRGTAFYVFLPLTEVPVVEKLRRRTTDSVEVRTGPELGVLLVDDNALVRKSTKRLLDSLGYRTVLAADGAKAIAVYEERQAEIDVVLLDVVMPNLGGVETLKILRRLNPQVSVVMMSGYDDEETRQRLARAEVSAFVSKPLDPREVARAIQDALPAPKT